MHITCILRYLSGWGNTKYLHYQQGNQKHFVSANLEPFELSSIMHLPSSIQNAYTYVMFFMFHILLLPWSNKRYLLKQEIE